MMRRRDLKAAEDRHVGFRWLAREAGLASEADAEAVFCVVARALAERVGPNEARHLASHMPLGLRELWDAETAGIDAPRRFERDELLETVQRELGLEARADAAWVTEAVFAWLKHLAPEERTDVAARLPHDLRETWEQAQLLHLPVPRRLHVRRRQPSP